MVVNEPVQAAIWHCLNHYAYRDAIFLAERLHAEVGSDEALFLLATCYYRAGKPTQAYTILQNAGCPTPQCRFLMAQCCLDINKLSEAETSLTGGVFQRHKSQDELATDFGDTSCFALRLLAKIYSKSERRSKASESFRRSLKLNPFLWSSYEALCHIGERPDPSKTFQVTSQNLSTACPSNVVSSPFYSAPSTPALQESTPTSLVDSMNQDTPPAPLVLHSNPHIINATPDSNVAMETTPVNALPSQNAPAAPVQSRIKTSLHFSSMESLMDGSVPDAPAKSKKPMTRRSQQSLSQNKPSGPFTQSNSKTTRTDATTSSQTSLQGGNAPALRRSSRLFACSSVKENNKSQSQRKFSCPNAPAKRLKSKSTKMAQELNEINKLDKNNSENKPSTMVDAKEHALALQKQSADGLMQLFQTLGKAYLALYQYDCPQALQVFNSLPPQHFNTGWVLSQVGRAHFEMADYQKAEGIFSEMRDREPHHIEGLELYSTTLWHLQKEVALSTLAHEIMAYDKHTPEACCVVGNCFSLQKEHDTAIRFFQRAVQLDPDFAYAYTLLGHEYVLTEELDKALSCFRNAIRVDPRHYNAWYGVGMVYYKQEKFSLAECHFRQALTINTQSSVLLCHVGVVQHALLKSDQALVTLDRAIEADPKNPLCKFHRASILFASDKHKEALSELEELKQIVPKESLVYFLIGKVHKKLGNTHLALMNFSWAMDLDPKGANNQIKEAINKRYVTEDDDSPAIGDSSALEDPLEHSSNASSLIDGDDAHLQAIESDESL